jgi:DNA primase
LVLPEGDPVREIAAGSIAGHPEWIADLVTADLLDTLAQAPAPPNPLDAAHSDELRAHLAHTLDQHSASPDPLQVEGALHALEYRRLERRQRELRTQIAEADRRGDKEALERLMTEKVEVDRRLRGH